MVTSQHPEDIGNRLVTEDGGFEGPDRAFATKSGKLAEEELMTADETECGKLVTCYTLNSLTERVVYSQFHPWVNTLPGSIFR